MKTIRIIFCAFLLAITGLVCQAQKNDLEIKKKNFRTLDKTIIEGQVGYLTVSENRLNANARKIKIKFIRLKSLAAQPEAPVIYLEGGGSPCTWQAESPKDLTDWLPMLQVSDLIFIDQRGTTDEKLTYVWRGEYPEGFFVSEQAANLHYQNLCNEALRYYAKDDIDILGYHVEAHARDVHGLTQALGIDRFSIFGFSYGTHIGMAVLKLYEEHVENAVFVGSDGLDQSFNYPSYLDEHFLSIAHRAKQDSSVDKLVPDLSKLLQMVMDQLTVDPAIVNLKNPLNKKTMKVKVGPFGLALILRLDIDDKNDIPVVPRLLYSIQQRDYSILEWFVQKRIALAFACPGSGINQGLASGASAKRWTQIEKEASESIFGNAMNFPFSAARKVWPTNNLSLDTTVPVSSGVRTLFVSGDLDCRTPVQQTNEIASQFANHTHLIVENAGHDQAMWDADVFDKAIPQFLKGEDVGHIKASYGDAVKFLPITGAVEGHPSVE